MNTIEMHIAKILKQMKEDLKTTSYHELGRLTGVDKMSIHRITHGLFAGNLETWKKLDKYYSQKVTDDPKKQSD